MTDHTIVAGLYLGGKSGMEVAAMLGVTYSRVYQILRKQGIPMRPPRKAVPEPKLPKPPRVVDKLLSFLREHPRSSVQAIAEGIGHPHRGTVGQLLSRLKTQGQVISESGNTFGYLWSVQNSSTRL